MNSKTTAAPKVPADFYAATTTHRVFVYGSLLSGLHNHGCLDGATFLGAARTLSGTWTMRDLGAFPALSHDDKGGSVLGEAYEVDGEVMARLDRLEGFPRFYTRSLVRVALRGRCIDAWVYHIEGRERGPVVPKNDWRTYLADREGIDDADLSDEDDDFPEDEDGQD